MTTPEQKRDAARKLRLRLTQEAEAGGYIVNPDEDFVLDLMEGLITNEERYGYWACPCRDAAGERAEDLDLICPCDYRDPDLAEYGMCYCALYVSEAVAKGEQKLRPIPERRPTSEERAAGRAESATKASSPLAGESSMPVWRCKVCGYLCARPEPPLKCPICKADQDRFESFP